MAACRARSGNWLGDIRFGEKSRRGIIRVMFNMLLG